MVASTETSSSSEETGDLGLSVVVPAHDEATRLPAFLDDTLLALGEEGLSFEVVVVDDGSRDETAEVVLARARFHPNVRLLRLDRNRGKGAATRVGMRASRGALRLLADADGGVGIRQWPRLRQEIAAGADIAVGVRQDAALWTRLDWMRCSLSRMFRGFVRALAVPGLEDTQCGFKLFTAAAAADLFGRAREDGYAFDVEILRLAWLRDYRVAAVPVIWRIDPLDQVRVWRDGLRMVFAVVRIRARRGQAFKATPRPREVPFRETSP